jgi:uncharacterized membrane protein YeaQ/YmgE (transglycosylase-associated protein family)
LAVIPTADAWFRIALGFIGALLGTWLAHALGLPELLAIPAGGMKFPIVWSIIGAALFVAVIGLISRRRVVNVSEPGASATGFSNIDQNR